MYTQVWEEIHGFTSPREYERFVEYIEKQVESGLVDEIEPNPEMRDGYPNNGRWFLDLETKEVWRLIEPDFPFKGTWEPVSNRGKTGGGKRGHLTN